MTDYRSVIIGLEAEVPPAPPVVPPTPPVVPTFLTQIIEWWNSLSTLHKALVIAGASGSVITVAGLSRRKKE